MTAARTFKTPVLLAMLLATGCAKKAVDTYNPGAEQQGDELAGLEQQLAQREGQLQAVGVTPAGPAPTERDAGQATTADITSAPVAEKQAGVGSGPPPATAAPTEETPNDAPVSRCEQVCEIAAAICSLEEQICGLLPRHRGDARYQSACDRSAADCQLANEACHACNPN